MSLKINLILALFLSSLLSNAAGNDSILKLSELHFNSEYEREAFVNFQKSGSATNVARLFLNDFTGISNINREKVMKQIDEAVNSLMENTKGYSEEKTVKAVYKYIHKQFFKLYKLENSFTDVFESGEYNCVSASAMYAIVFSKMKIPHLVMEAPQHVYLIAYPATHKILIETTSPSNGYFIFNDGYTQKFVRYLHNAKLINNEEYNNNSTEVLFNKYYFDKNGLSDIALAGIQFSNYSVYHTDAGDYEKAMEEMKKAYYLWPSEKTKYVLQWLLFNNLNLTGFKKENNLSTFALLCRFNNNNETEVSDENIKHEFNRAIQVTLIENSDYAKIEKIFNRVYTELNDTLLKKDIAFAYHFELARLGYINSTSKNEELEQLGAAYKINNKHADLLSIIKLYFKKLIEKTEDPEQILNYMNDFTNQFSFLKSDDDFNATRANCLLQLAYQHITLNNIIKGEKYLTDFETLFNGAKNTKPNEYFVEKAYATAASYYFKRGNVTKTREFLKRGIVFAPENFGLHKRLNETR